ncbi:MAG TPA: hypothetical protein PKE31_11510 [Pseudomonadota bacterium]|nr:hypothetical protein [Pseudomonadota bacterium]
MRRLRPFFFAFLFLLFFEIGLRVVYPKDERVLSDVRNPFGCFADEELLRLKQLREQDQDDAEVYDIVLLGDSVLASDNNATGERLLDLLPQELARNATSRRFRVFSYSKSAARAWDQLAAVRTLEERLLHTRKGLQNVVLVVSTNPVFFSRRFSAEAMNYPCLANALEPAMERNSLGLPAGAQPGLWEASDAFLGKLAARLYLFQQRRRIAENWFGGPVRIRLREWLVSLGKRRETDPHTKMWAQHAAEQRNLPWNMRGIDRDSYRADCDFLQRESPKAWNWRGTEALFSHLGTRKGVSVLVFVTPHNHFLLGPLSDGNDYRKLQSELENLAKHNLLSVVNYDRHPDLKSEHFVDIDHENLDGNRVLARLLARDLLKLFDNDNHNDKGTRK